jgi:hypothetical protein
VFTVDIDSASSFYCKKTGGYNIYMNSGRFCLPRSGFVQQSLPAVRKKPPLLKNRFDDLLTQLFTGFHYPFLRAGRAKMTSVCNTCPASRRMISLAMYTLLL